LVGSSFLLVSTGSLAKCDGEGNRSGLQIRELGTNGIGRDVIRKDGIG
jgi:hypothetical protein